MSDSVEPILYEASSAPLAKVVLVHGALDRAMAFRGVLQRLHAYDVTVYDRRGYGAAVGLTPATSLEDHVADLIAVLDTEADETAALDGTPSVVIGHSMGGAIAMLAAASRPDLVQSLGVFEPPLPGVILPTDDSPTSFSVPEDPEHLVRWMYKRVVGESAFGRMDARAQRALVAEAPALRVDLLSVRNQAKPFDPTSVAVPTVVGYGAASVPRLIARSEWLAEQLPNATLFEAPEAQHACHRSHPELFANFVIEATDVAA